ncbi:hypothetical protein RGE_36190 [Rubrivivax gelatinosus IL144]|uniref:Uncharacterized protein n=1 Tax=Rubrivivax gelatinosus (strain NBRC 100245 / IL144) TaxID=983917 RepID=I0HVC1_RUBGI|nr:hypothetical protein RGE_36190 [Rubrivivax gelatinosus IL144]
MMARSSAGLSEVPRAAFPVHVMTRRAATRLAPWREAALGALRDAPHPTCNVLARACRCLASARSSLRIASLLIRRGQPMGESVFWRSASRPGRGHA